MGKHQSRISSRKRSVQLAILRVKDRTRKECPPTLYGGCRAKPAAKLIVDIDVQA